MGKKLPERLLVKKNRKTNVTNAFREWELTHHYLKRAVFKQRPNAEWKLSNNCLACHSNETVLSLIAYHTEDNGVENDTYDNVPFVWSRARQAEFQ
jgi:hypothetical protein